MAKDHQDHDSSAKDETPAAQREIDWVTAQAVPRRC
jgi:hypothetical protein